MVRRARSRPTAENRVSSGEWAIIIALLLLAFALRTIDLTRVPPGLHNDEVVDIKITESVVHGRRAIFFPEDTGAEPLYYYFAAPFLRVLGSTVFAMRLPAVFLSMLGMCVIWALARRLLGPVVALTALAGFTLVFWTVAFGRIALHVVMLVPLAALAAYCFWRAGTAPAGGGRRKAGVGTWFLWAMAGLWLGLAINTYTAARVLPAVFIAFGAYVLVARRAEWRRWWAGIAITLVVMAVVVLPLTAYLLRHSAADQLDFFDIDRPLVELRGGNPRGVIKTSLRTLGMFAFVGDPLPYYDVPGRPVLEPFGVSLLAAGLVIALWRWRQPEYAFIVLWFFLSLLPGMLSQPAPNYTRTLGVQVVLFAIPGIAVAALLEWASRLNSGKAGLWLGIALILLFAGNLAWTVHDYFVIWPSVGSVRFWHQSGLKAVADRLQADTDTSPVAVCVPEHLIDERDPWWKPAWQHMRYLLHRPDLSLRYYNCLDAMVLADGPARYAFPDVPGVDALAQFPVYSEFLAAVDPLDLDIDVLPDGLGVIVRDSQVPGHGGVRAVLDQRLDDVVKPGGLSPSSGLCQSGEETVLFGLDPVSPVVEFLGYELSRGHEALQTRTSGGDADHGVPAAWFLRPGDSFDLVTYWRVVGELPQAGEWTPDQRLQSPPQLLQFTHVLNADGAAPAAIVAQQDRLALTFDSLWAGDVFVQIHHLTLPGDLAAGEYPVTIGLYTPSDGIRLRITQGGRPGEDRLRLGSVVVEE